MSTQTAVFNLNRLLPCACDADAELYLCLNPASLAAPDAVGYQPSGISATLVKVYKDSNSCGQPIWRYIVRYDDADVADPTKVITGDQISGVVCKNDCQGLWIQDQIGPQLIGVTGQIGSLIGADFNSVADQPITLDPTAYFLEEIIVTNASVNMDTAQGAIYASPAGVDGIIGTDVFVTLTAPNMVQFYTHNVGFTNFANTQVLTNNPIYLKLDIPQGIPATADIYIYGRVITP